jgi:hypothetical protein
VNDLAVRGDEADAGHAEVVSRRLKRMHVLKL